MKSDALLKRFKALLDSRFRILDSQDSRSGKFESSLPPQNASKRFEAL